jgi:ATP-dependent DNA helicase RecQ
MGKQFLFQLYKAKGKEFDNVFLMLENFDATKDEKRRQLYVALTRARQKLIIHLNGNYLDKMKTDELERVENNDAFSPPSELALHLSHKDIQLGYFEFIQNRVNFLTSGDSITISEEGCKNEKGELVLKFSKKFADRLIEIKKSGFELRQAKVNFIVYWKAEDKEQEVKIILPELQFEKIDNTNLSKYK